MTAFERYFLLYDTCPEAFESGFEFMFGLVFLILFVTLLLDIPLAIRERVHSNWRIRHCHNRFAGLSGSPCRYHACPQARWCQFYKPRRSFRQWWQEEVVKRV